MMGRPATIWTIRDVKTDEVVFRGTTKECADFCGTNIKNFYITVTRYGGYKQYEAEESFCATDRKADDDAIYNWDRFMEPLRKKYGIPIRRIRTGEAG